MNNFMQKVTEISKKVGDSVVDTYKIAVDKSESFIEDTKYKFSITEKKNDIDEICISLGSTVYDMYLKGEDVGKVFTKECKKIQKVEKEIADLEKRILFNKGLRLCDECNSKILIESKFCTKCGVKQKAYKAPKDLEETKEVQSKVCKFCGEILEEEAKFCHKCGEKV